MREVTLDIGSNISFKLYECSSSYARKYNTLKNNIGMIREKK
jgi:hypothetical protein